MKLYQDLQYVGNDKKFNLFTNKIWHCTNFVVEYSTNEMKYCMQQPYYQDGEFVGYSNLDVYVFTEYELVENFKIVKKDGTLEDIQHSRDDIELQYKVKYIDDIIKDKIGEDDSINPEELTLNDLEEAVKIIEKQLRD